MVWIHNQSIVQLIMWNREGQKVGIWLVNKQKQSFISILIKFSVDISLRLMMKTSMNTKSRKT